MPSRWTTRRLAVGGVFAFVPAAALGLARGLPDLGTGPPAGDDGGSHDATLDVTTTQPDADGSLGQRETGADGSDDVTQPCTTVDAACVGSLPPGWQPVTMGDAGCAAGFEAQTFVTNPRLQAGGCACGACETRGSFVCTDLVPLQSGVGCTAAYADAAPGVCTTPANTKQHVEAFAPQATAGTATCFVPNDAGTGVTTDDLTVCVPGCTADYCGAPGQCVMFLGDAPCPSPFTPFAKVGAQATFQCAPCPCTLNPPGPCAGSVSVYSDTMCNDFISKYPLNQCGTVPDAGSYASVFVQLLPQAPSCAPTDSTADTGDAGLVDVKTICCK